MQRPINFKAGFIGIVGRPNVGKSTLMNLMVGQKVSIVTRKPQTTRHRIVGIKQTAHSQMIFVDTPGIHYGEKKAMNRYMNRSATSIVHDVDVVLFMIDRDKITAEDNAIIQLLSKVNRPICIAINKVDLLVNKEKILPLLQLLKARINAEHFFPISAKKNTGINVLEKKLLHYLPNNDRIYDKQSITDKSERFIAAELIREQLLLRIHQEIPYSSTVQIEKFVNTDSLITIHALVWVERDNHKLIVIGHKGETLKMIGQNARLAMEDFFQQKVYLRLWVKVAKKWTDSEQQLGRFGYID